MKKSISLLLIIILVISLSACSMNPPEWAKPGKHKELKDMKIGLSISTLDNPFFVSLKNGVIQEAASKGIKVITVDAQNDTEKQMNDIEDLIQQGVDMLLINPTDSAAISSAVQSANHIGIPVITLDRSADKGKVETLVASDNITGGKMAANFIINKVGKHAKVVELQGTPGASAARERGQGFHEIADKKLDVIAKQTANFDRTQGLNVMENLLQGHKDIQAVFAQNDEMALGAIEAIKSSGRDIVVVGFDGTDDGIKAVKEGRLSATVAQQPVLIGKQAVIAASKVLQGKKVKSRIAVPLKLIQ
ncbi:ribose ABC transporter substrate-binding protein RbsB [Heyndrickxia ginsengihumi]|uniref:Ribose import binding protein RbsB n=1 Tax=Heyndrickxia ginsengihumi TaxID=363870 RepID=A0A6M0P6T6_9BACI|nr:ribose ABC transporter substrate-binding protein RbsB [Heyndrickxia ginsengihumi]MCM3023458.1 ribose ABC transporter substrate-binding protein RbsB [Heyndrickxia ginsengihumi]NEY20271.1 ribose ABC transporter substrate-binding protein RbsB [Heyndrickxia ginsengihumi]